MNIKARLIFAVIFLLFFNVVLAEDFSADMISRTQSFDTEGRIFVSNNKIRMEMMGTISIVRMDKNVSWMLMPEQKTYMELPIKPQDIIATSEKIPGEVKRELIGKETISGNSTDKYKVIYSMSGQEAFMFVWLVPGSNIPVRTQAQDGSWMIEYRNINIAPQSASLFEIPSGYQKFSYQMPSMKDILEQAANGMQ